MECQWIRMVLFRLHMESKWNSWRDAGRAGAREEGWDPSRGAGERCERCERYHKGSASELTQNWHRTDTEIIRWHRDRTLLWGHRCVSGQTQNDAKRRQTTPMTPYTPGGVACEGDAQGMDQSGGGLGAHITTGTSQKNGWKMRTVQWMECTMNFPGMDGRNMEELCTALQ